MNNKNLQGVISNSSVILERLQVNVFIANLDFKLVYMNPTAIKALKSIENEIFEVFSLRVHDLIGVSLDGFYRDPNRMEQVLNDAMILPDEVMLELGNVFLKTNINSIVSTNGEILGYIVNWEDVTNEVEVDEEMSQRIAELELIESESNNY